MDGDTPSSELERLLGAPGAIWQDLVEDVVQAWDGLGRVVPHAVNLVAFTNGITMVAVTLPKDTTVMAAFYATGWRYWTWDQPVPWDQGSADTEPNWDTEVLMFKSRSFGLA